MTRAACLTPLLVPLLLFVACSPESAGNTSLAAAGEEAEVPLLTVAGQDSAGCTIEWEGRPVTHQEAKDRVFLLIEQAIAQTGGIVNMSLEAVPVFRLEAAPETPYACVSLTVGDLEHNGVPRVALQLAGDANAQEQIVNLLLPDAEPFSPVGLIEIGSGHRLYWNRQLIDSKTLRDYLRQSAAQVSLPQDMLLAPAADASFGSVYSVVSTVRQARIDLTLAGCTRTNGPRVEGEPIGVETPPCRDVAGATPNHGPPPPAPPTKG